MISVAPLVGAWIEIMVVFDPPHLLKSLLSWERGLKSFDDNTFSMVVLSLLSWERGLKYAKTMYA